MRRTLLATLALITLAACTRNPEGAEGRRSSPRPAPDPVAEAANEPDPLPPGHPPLDLGDPGLEPAAPTTDVEGNRATVAGVAWEATEPLRFRQPTSTMRAAEYIVEGGDESTVLTVFFFPGGGGGIQANIDRWVGQMQTTENRPPEITHRTVAELPVTRIDVHGGFGGMQMPGQEPGQEAGQEAGRPAGGFRMLGAIVEGPQGPVFFKLVGPEATVDLAADAFEHLIASFHAAP